MSFTIPQNLYVNDSTVLTVAKCSDDAVGMLHLLPLLNATDHTLGVAATYGTHCQLSSIAFSTSSRVLVVDVPARHVPQPAQDVKRRLVARGRALIQEHLLLSTKFQKYAFKMDQLAVALHLDLSVHINAAVDMLSVSNAGRHSLQALMNAMGGETILHRKNVQSLLSGTSKSPMVDGAADVALQAWAACRAATLPHMLSRFESLPRIDTSAFPKAHLDTLASIFRSAERLEALKPTEVKNDVEAQFTVKNDAINLMCGRFPTRIKQSSNQFIRIEVKGETATNQVTGRACKVDGKSVFVNVKGPVRGNKIVSVTTVGKDKPTFAEVTRQEIISKTLQRGTSILSGPFFQALWLPNERPVWPKPKEQRGDIPVRFSKLNASQRAAVEKILSDDESDRIVIIQGPPGTGKTTVIAASVISHFHADSTQSIWVAAQSNVAVKNIAEKFFKEGFDEFKLLVSKDFHYDWHEHLYEAMERCLIRSDDFKKSVLEANTQLCGCKVILCTLSMFSNPNADVYLRVLPVDMLILDEASQIECGDYLPILHLFRPTLSKMVFVGDDKQLPPYGQEDIPELRSVFEFPHLRSQALFLDTQYRMPHIIGTFISQNVYGGKLRTCHSPTTSQACRFIDVRNGQETKQGHSWTNHEEARVVLRLARFYESKGFSFRIITPYDAQRALIENYLKTNKLKWEDKVFNIDSFQGNEADNIIVSVVRSRAPGFLRNQRRTNVMLTRCKHNMIICSSRDFLFDEASSTLIGKLAASMKEENWIEGST